jgi:ElaB/YqjD/DUF883 family membrane-anchored ribosome-binding protein
MEPSMEANAEGRDDSVRTTVQNLISECESLLTELGDEGARRYRDGVTSLQRQMRRARDDLDDFQYSTVRRAKRSIRRADAYVHDNPWQSAGAAAAAGALIGAVVAILLTRR